MCTVNIHCILSGSCH